jgi:hypothetical protein
MVELVRNELGPFLYEFAISNFPAFVYLMCIFNANGIFWEEQPRSKYIYNTP